MEYDDEIYTNESIALKLHLTPEVVRWRRKQLGIESQGTGKKNIYSEEDFERIMNYQRKRYVCKKIDLKTRFAIVELFTTTTENSVRNISEATGISKSTVNYVINEYLKNKRTIIVESKMNHL